MYHSQLGTCIPYKDIAMSDFVNSFLKGFNKSGLIIVFKGSIEYMLEMENLQKQCITYKILFSVAFFIFASLPVIKQDRHIDSVCINRTDTWILCVSTGQTHGICMCQQDRHMDYACSKRADTWILHVQEGRHMDQQKGRYMDSACSNRTDTWILYVSIGQMQIWYFYQSAHRLIWLKQRSDSLTNTKIQYSVMTHWLST